MHIQVPKPHKMEGVNMNKATFQAYIFQLLFGAGLACLLPFLSLYFRYLGLTASQVGLIIGTKAAVNMIWAPCWTRCSTRFHKKRFVLMFSVFVLLGTFLLMLLIPPVNQAVSNLQFCPLQQSNDTALQKLVNLTEGIVVDENVEAPGKIGEKALTEGPPPVNPPTTEAMHTEAERSSNFDSSDLDLEKTKALLAKYGIPANRYKDMSKEELLEFIQEELKILDSETNDRSQKHSKHNHFGSRQKRLVRGFKGYKHKSTLGKKDKVHNEKIAEAQEERNQGDDKNNESMENTEEIPQVPEKLEESPTDEKEPAVTEHPLDIPQAATEEELGDETQNKSPDNPQDPADEKSEMVSDETENENPDADVLDTYPTIPSSQSKMEGVTESSTTALPINGTKFITPGNIYDTLANLMNRINKLPGQINTVINEKIFAAILCLILVGEMFSAPAEKLADDIWFEFLDSTDALEKYGSHKMWACLGLALVPPGVAAIIDNSPCMLEVAHHQVNRIMIHFYCFAGFIGLAFLLSFCYPIYTSSDGKKVLQRRSRFCRGIKTLFNDVHASLFTVSVLILGMLQGCLYTFLFWQVQDTGGSELIMGLSLTAAYGGEFLMISIQRWLVMKMGYPVAVTMGMFLMGARFVFYSFLWNPWLVLIGEGFHCFSGTLVWAAVRNYPDFRLNPLIMDRSANSVLNSLYQGLGVAPGCLIAGYVYEWVGADILFQAASITATVWCILFAIIHKCTKKPQKVRYAKLLQEDENVSDGSMEYDDDWLEVAMKHQH